MSDEPAAPVVRRLRELTLALPLPLYDGLVELAPAAQAPSVQDFAVWLLHNALQSFAQQLAEQKAREAQQEHRTIITPQEFSILQRSGRLMAPPPNFRAP